MPLAIKVQFFQEGSKYPEQELEPDWWKAERLLDQHSFDFIGDWTFRDYEYYASGEEFIDLHLDHLKYIKEGVFAFHSWQGIIDKKREAIEQIILNIHSYKTIRIYVFEYG
ncbi:MAG: hypothetical protein AAFY71_27645 [Bacteroidota bacterium]